MIFWSCVVFVVGSVVGVIFGIFGFSAVMANTRRKAKRHDDPPDLKIVP